MFFAQSLGGVNNDESNKTRLGCSDIAMVHRGMVRSNDSFLCNGMVDEVMANTVELPEQPMCDIHKYHFNDPNVKAVRDQGTVHGPWAYMCLDCAMKYGVGQYTNVKKREG